MRVARPRPTRNFPVPLASVPPETSFWYYFREGLLCFMHPLCLTTLVFGALGRSGIVALGRSGIGALGRSGRPLLLQCSRFPGFGTSSRQCDPEWCPSRSWPSCRFSHLQSEGIRRTHVLRIPLYPCIQGTRETQRARYFVDTVISSHALTGSASKGS